MKKIISTAFLLSISTFAHSQIDTINTKIKSFQYRIKMENVNTKLASIDIKTELNDIFRTEPSFIEHISEFVFVSNLDIEYQKICSVFSSSSYKLISFKKIEITK